MESSLSQRTRKMGTGRRRALLFSARSTPSQSWGAPSFVSRPTGMRWRERYEQTGLAGIAERSRRPQQSPTQTPAELEQRVVEMRRRYPDWGARKLQVLLAREGVELTRSTVHRILLRRDLVRDSDRHRQALQRFERGEPNQLWQMDYKSPKGWNAAVGPLSVLDDHSRYLLCCRRCGAITERMCASSWRRRLVVAGCRRHADGSRSAVVERDRSDGSHGSDVVANETRDPAALERIPASANAGEGGAVSRQPGAGAAGAGSAAQQPQGWLDEYRWEYNQVRPHEALGMRTPASVWRKSERDYQPQPPRWEYAAGAKVRKLDCQGKLTVKGRNWPISVALRGEWVQLEQIGERVLVYYCRTVIRELAKQKL